MEGPKVWSRDLAVQDALVKHGIPKRDRHHTRRAETALSLQPQTLRVAWADVLKRLPDDWRARAECVYVFAPPEVSDCSPSAATNGRQSRRVEVPRGFVWLLIAFGNALSEVREPLLDWLRDRQGTAPRDDVSLHVLWQWVLDNCAEFVASHQASTEVQAKVACIAEVAVDPRAAWETKQESGGDSPATKEVEVLVAHSLRFALAHELGHHLLNHLDPQSDVAELGVQNAVEGWAGSLGITIPDGLNREEAQEWHADAFALMTLSRSVADGAETAEFFRITALAGAAATALLALFVGGEALQQSGQQRRSHPRVEARLDLVIQATTLVGRDTQEPSMFVDNDDIDAEAGMYALQVFGGTVVILELLLRMRIDGQ